MSEVESFDIDLQLLKVRASSRLTTMLSSSLLCILTILKLSVIARAGHQNWTIDEKDLVHAIQSGS